ncbi:hypothetical protein BDN70DRAFT_878080 [Pholiota conissans]|uniref:Uncharacterized protein n=1 Tax=Pholiota conissans TaxID=109636 RepID=A0A9P5Z2Q2_9AGAR|nr:hypothetical protein BDN70DRAFT_878080 [Pholiota conissans]
MEFATYAVPQISISLAPPEEHFPEPISPFRSLTTSSEDDGFRSSHLTPPPTVTNFKRPRSPLNRAENIGKGLENDRFQSLLNASKIYSGGKREGNLRKEIALKTHKNKQAERRALFLSKLQAPPSPTATTTPKTPPDSPAIFHYTLPSPGLVSPLALFETLHNDQEGIPGGWVEQVDFRLPEQKVQRTPTHTRQPSHGSHGLPSLDQISARFTPQVKKMDALSIQGLAPYTAPQPRPSVDVGRLRMPLRTPATAPQPVVAPVLAPVAEKAAALPPKSPLFHSLPQIRVTTLVVPRSHTTSPVELTERNLRVFNARDTSRDQKANDMLSKLRRRTLTSECMFGTPTPKDEVDYKWRRRSAPADIMPLRPRNGFEHPVLALPGGF